MALSVKTTDPTGLLTAIKKEIADKKIVTWNYLLHEKKDYFTHNPDQWLNKAWLTPTIGINELNFSIIWPANSLKDKEISAVYHGRFAEMLIKHFEVKFTSIVALKPFS